MEYLKINFEEDRKSIVCGRSHGVTNLTMELVKKSHLIITQSPPDNFTQKAIEVILKGTTYNNP